LGSEPVKVVASKNCMPIEIASQVRPGAFDPSTTMSAASVA
jgi:hypothetical protein